ncbi:hypothetical protein SDC9_89962 [bioreactor metagenome]|uniref:Uncharacterized protein n=1 Tax=bioreactor metagenome TaxID=1076179 RepID=A0A644ZQM8_9ZZZZ
MSKDVLNDIAKILSVDCIINGDNPRAIQGNNTLKSILKYFFLIFNKVLSPVRNFITHNAETPCDIIVAKAAPFTPILNTKMKIGSSIMFNIAPTSTVSILVLANPCAVINAFRPKASCTNSVP